MSPSTFFRRCLAFERHPLGALAWRTLVCQLAFLPWGYRLERVDFRPETLDPEILHAARALGIDPFSPANWTTAPEAILKVVGLALGLALLWWAVSRLRRLATRRLGPGLLAALVPVGGFIAFQVLQSGPLGSLMQSPVQTFATDALPVWQGWLRHPFFKPLGFTFPVFSLTLLGLLVGELLLLALEHRLLLQEAQDRALRARLTPHFLHNALNTLYAQIPGDPEGARETTQRLSGLFDQVSRATEQPRVPLSQELAFLEDFLALERRRLGERLRVQVEIPEDLLDQPVPVLGLQVLVENSLKHAIAPRPEGGTLHLKAWTEGRHLHLSVTDSGDGQSRAGTGTGTGQALANLRARLASPSDLTTRCTPEGFETRLRVGLA